MPRSTMPRTSEKKPWRKILYEKQDFPDNYVDSTFLKELQKNLHVTSYSYGTLVCESTNITLQLTSAVQFVALYLNMEDGTLSPQELWVLSVVLTVLGYAAHQWLMSSHGKESSSVLNALKTCILFQCFSAALSPILVSLTETISTDTIYFMTTMMLLGNLLFYNYEAKEEGGVPGALSLNAAVFASVCLASRLHTAWHAFTTVTVSFELFALWPVLQGSLKMHLEPRGRLLMTFLVVAICTVSIFLKTTVGGVLYVLAVIFITFICPAWLLYLQPLKNNIYGPWDEAVIKENS